MSKIKAFFINTLLGGVVVILPTALIVFLLKWVYDFVTNLVSPLAQKISDSSAMNEKLATLITILLILSVCFMVGLIVRTRLGGWLMRLLESTLLQKIPGYNLIRETVAQFLGAKQSPFSTVALAAAYNDSTYVSCFITDRHENGWYTIFVPTGPNPTSGNIFHLSPDKVHIVDVPVEDAMRSIISCGAGSTKLVKAMNDSKGGNSQG